MALFSSFRFRFRISNFKYVFDRNKYVVLLPEIPDDTPETNPLLQTNVYPPFTKLTTEHCINAVGKLLVEHEIGIHELQERLYDPTVPKNVQNVIVPLDQLSAPFDFAWATLKVLHTVKHDDRIAEAYMKLHPRILKAKRERYLSSSIYRAFKEMKIDEKQFMTPVQRIINKYLLESQLSGIELSDSKFTQFQKAIYKIEHHKRNFRTKLRESTAKFEHVLTDSEMSGLPPEMRYYMGADQVNHRTGPWKLTLAPHIYKPFMEYCDIRLLRWNVWRANCVRASTSSGTELNNSIEIEEMRFLRNDQANLVGFKDFAELSMKTKMAGSVENVMSMITTLHVKSKDATIKELNDLQTFASENRFEHKLELWDVPYWQRRHKETLFSCDEALVRQYFPFPTVLKGLFNFCEDMFGIKIQEKTSDVNKWHNDVSVYDIYDKNDKCVASFYLDPYVRPESKLRGAWMEIGRNRSDVIGVNPLSYLLLNFIPPKFGKPSLLSFSDLHILLQKFGHILQHSLTTVPYSDVSGLTNLEWDVVNVVPHVMSHWLRHYDTVAHMSGHVDTGAPLPEKLHQQLCQARQYMAGLHLTEQLYLSALDIHLYSRRNFWYEIMKETWAKYLNFPFEKYQAHVCSFTQIFCDEYPAAYFSFLWAEMIAADVFSAFEEAGLNNKEAVQQVGRRFLDTYLSLGGGCHPSEIFRRFRGRDPSTEALLCSYGLMHRH